MPRAITRLSDHFGQFDLLLVCANCGHRREIAPRDLARLFGWDALIVTIVARLRCSKCGARRCSATAQLPSRPRRYSSLPR